MRRAAARVAAVLACCLGLIGCAAAPPTGSVSSSSSPSDSATAVASLPSGGIYLTDMGFAGAPPGFSVPAAAKPTSYYGIPTLIDIVYDGADGPMVHDYLLANLPAMGFTVTGQSADSIVWHDDVWDGAFTMTSAAAGLTLRQR